MFIVVRGKVCSSSIQINNFCAIDMLYLQKLKRTLDFMYSVPNSVYFYCLLMVNNRVKH